MALVDQVMSTEPYASAKRVFWIVDNGSSHLDEVRNRLRAFEDRYNATAQPFQWKFTTTDLDDLLARLDRHTLTDQQEESSAAILAAHQQEH
jgi:hypothetical protein